MFFGKALKEQYEKRLQEQANLYEARISQLQSQIEDLRKMVFVPTSATSLPLVQIEQDAILSGKEEQVTITQEELAQLEMEQSEADRIFAGTY